MIYYIAEFEALGCEAEFYLNDVPVARARKEEPYHGRPVNHLLLPGRNALMLASCLGPAPSSARSAHAPVAIEPGATSASAKLWRLPAGGFPRDPGSELVCQLQWTPGAPLTLAKANEDVALFELPQDVPVPRWTQCEPLPKDFAAQAAAVMRALRESLSARDPEPFIRMARSRFEDCAAAFGIDLAQDIEGFRQQLAEQSAAVFEPFDEAAFDPRPVGGGRLVDCQDHSWRSPLRTTPDSKGAVKLSYQTRIGRLNGEWRIVL